MKKDNIPGLEGYYISRLGILWSRYHKSSKLTQNEWHKVKLTKTQRKEILYRSKRGESIGELANLFGVSKVTVRRVLNPNLRSFNRIR